MIAGFDMVPKRTKAADGFTDVDVRNPVAVCNRCRSLLGRDDHGHMLLHESDDCIEALADRLARLEGKS